MKLILKRDMYLLKELNHGKRSEAVKEPKPNSQAITYQQPQNSRGFGGSNSHR